MAIVDPPNYIAIITALLELMRQDDDDENIDLINELVRVGPLQLLEMQNGRGIESEFVGIENFVEETVWQYPDLYFHKHFRLTRTAFEVQKELVIIDLHSLISILTFRSCVTLWLHISRAIWRWPFGS